FPKFPTKKFGDVFTLRPNLASRARLVPVRRERHTRPLSAWQWSDRFCSRKLTHAENNQLPPHIFRTAASALVTAVLRLPRRLRVRQCPDSASSSINRDRGSVRILEVITRQSGFRILPTKPFSVYGK